MTVEHMRLLTEAQVRALTDDLCREHHAEGCAPMWINVPCVDRVFRSTQHYGVINNMNDHAVVITVSSAAIPKSQVADDHLILNADEATYILREVNRLIPGLLIRTSFGDVAVYSTPEWSALVLRLVLYKILLGVMDDG